MGAPVRTTPRCVAQRAARLGQIAQAVPRHAEVGRTLDAGAERLLRPLELTVDQQHLAAQELVRARREADPRTGRQELLRQ